MRVVHKESWAPKNWCFWTVVLEKTLESPLGCKKIKQSILKEINPEYSLERLIAQAESPVLWSHDRKNWPVGKDSDAGKDWRQEEKEMTEDEMIGCYHRFNRYELEQAPRDGEGQRSLACCRHAVTKSRTWLSDWTELTDWRSTTCTEKKVISQT